jgi:hypothetical protein
MQRSVSRRVAVALASSWLVVAAGCSPSAEVVGTSADVGVETGAGGSADAGSPDAAEVVGTSADADVEPAGDARPNVDRAARRPTCPVADATCVPVTPAVDVRDACLGVRWVGPAPRRAGRVPGRRTTACRRWHLACRVERLFGDDAPTGLRGYCTYSWEPSAGGDPNLVPAKGTDYLEAFGGRLSQGTDAIEVVSKDCLAVGVQDTDVTQAVGRVAESAYYAAVDQVHPLPDGANGGPAAIRVSVVDSTPPRVRRGRRHGWADPITV